MKLSTHLASLAAFAALTLSACSSTSNDTTHSSIQDDKKTTTPAMGGHGAQDMKLPPGWSMEDMQACMAAGTPGKNHEMLAKSTGVWKGKSTMWMGPGMEPPMKSECTSTITTVMDGRYTKNVIEGDMPGMGPFHGLGFNGFDNVSQKFVSSWIDNHSSGIMNGTGELSADGKTMTWIYTYNCPIRKAPAKMREVHRYTSDNAMTFEMYGDDPKTGKEYKMMEIQFTRKS